MENISTANNPTLQSSSNILNDPKFLSTKGELVFPIGMTERGELIVEDLSEIPHMFICGGTGTGKTSFVQTMIAIFATRYQPDVFCFSAFDSKLIEYDFFKSTPHLIRPIDHYATDAIDTIDWLNNVTQNRLNAISRSGCRDRKSFNELNYSTNKEEKMSNIFYIMDDFSSIALNKDDMNKLLNVIRNGRIVGIHLVIVTSMISTKKYQKDLMNLFRTN